jgi:cold shock CspA family protein/cytidylate kinase
MDNIIVIYGKTCSLKTEVAQELSEITGFKVTNRGEKATTQAKYTRVATAGALPESFHRELDEETRQMARRDEKLMIFESTFMDEVLKDLANAYLIRLRSDDAVRSKRWTQRKEEAGGRTRQLGESVEARDAEDAQLRQKLYGAPESRARPILDIDTTDRKAADVAREIWESFVAKSGLHVVTKKPPMDKTAARGISPGPTSGKVSRYNSKQPPFGGYITDTRSGKDIYVHKSALGESGFTELSPGQEVAFDIVADSFGGFKAMKVRSRA